MKTLDDLLLAHPSTLRARGRSYQAQGRVRVLERTPALVRASVRGTWQYTVRLELGARGWKHDCTCPAHAERGQCKHVCAVLEQLVGRALSAGVDRDDEEEWDALGDEDAGSDPADAEDEHDEADEARARADDALLRSLLSNTTLPESAKRRLLGHLTQGRVWSGDAAPKDATRLRGERLLAALQTALPAAGAPRTSVRLRYVLSPRAPSSSSVGLEVQAARSSAKGAPGAWRAVHAPPHETELDELDRMASAVLVEGPRDRSNAYTYLSRPALLALQPALQRLLLPKLAAENRLWFAASSTLDPDPIVLDPLEPWTFALEVERSADGFRLEGVLRRGDERVPLADVRCVLAGGFAVVRGLLATVEWHGAHAWAAHLAGEQAVAIGRERASDVARILARAPLALPLTAAGLVEDVAGAPQPVLTLLAPGDSGAALEARIAFLYGTERVRRGTSAVTLKGERVLRVRRDAEAEARAESEFVASGGKLMPRSRDADGFVAQRALAAVVGALTERKWLVEAEGVKLRTDGSFQLGVRSGIDWFDVEADVRFGAATVELPALLEALSERRPLVRLSDGSLGVVPERWLDQWKALGELGEVEDGVLRVKRTRGFLLDVLLAEKEGVRCDAGFQELRARLARARDPAPLAEPKGFQGELRPYQRAGVGWLAFLGEAGLGGCLADDMGLGKTVQVLAHVLRRKERARGPALVVAPMSLVFNWQDEAARFAPKLDVRVHHGLGRARTKAPIEDADLVVTTYGTLRQDARLLGDVRFDLVVLDEAQAIKNPSSQSAKAARLLEADQRLALTGTPIENRIQDLLSIFEFLNPGLLEGSRALRHLLDGSDEVETVRLVARALGPFLLRRTKEAVLQDLPPKTEQVVHCELDGPQRREYDELRKHYQKELLAQVDAVGIEKAGMNVLEALLRLRQAACHLALIDPDHAKTRSAKLGALLEMLEELVESGHKALVFSQFTGFLALVKQELDARDVPYEYLDGATRDRKDRVERFQADESKRVFLISLKAGGVGLNLTAADYVFLLDPWWNPAVERQAIDRTHRIGQTRSVTAYRLVAKDTVEEKVLALQAKKRALADALFEGQGGGLKGLTRGDLEALLA